MSDTRFDGKRLYEYMLAKPGIGGIVPGVRHIPSPKYFAAATIAIRLPVPPRAST
jgi:hypothetical protein